MSGVDLNSTNLGDLLKTTLDRKKNDNITDLTQSLQRFPVMKMALDNAKTEEGTHLTVNALTSTNGSAKMTKLYGDVTHDRNNGVVAGSVTWTHANINMSLDEREIGMNSSNQRILDLVNIERARMFGDWAKLLNAQINGAPTSTSDTETLQGYTHWIQKNASDGFTGGNPSGFSGGCAGIDSDTYTGYKNYVHGYTAATRDDLVEEMREAQLLLDFMAPGVGEPSLPGANMPARYAIVTNRTRFRNLERVAEDNNMNLGWGLDMKDGAPRFYGNQIVWDPLLDAETDHPVYFIDWNSFQLCKLRGYWGNQVGPRNLENQPMVWAVDINFSFQCRATNRRSLGILYVR